MEEAVQYFETVWGFLKQYPCQFLLGVDLYLYCKAYFTNNIGHTIDIIHYTDIIIPLMYTFRMLSAS